MAAWLIVVEWLARLLLLFLAGLSVWSIAIILDRRKFFAQLAAHDQEDKLFDWIRAGQRQKALGWANGRNGVRAGAIQAALARTTPEQMERSVQSYWSTQRTQLEKGLPILGTLGATTPFVGLLGTILGIIVAFGALSTGQLDSQKVMYSLAEALTATAIGLAVAIPAVVAFNYFNRRVLILERECAAIKDLALSYFTEKQ